MENTILYLKIIKSAFHVVSSLMRVFELFQHFASPVENWLTFDFLRCC